MTTERMLAYLREKVAPLLQGMRANGRDFGSSVDTSNGMPLEWYGATGQCYALNAALGFNPTTSRGYIVVHLCPRDDDGERAPGMNLFFEFGDGWQVSLVGKYYAGDGGAEAMLHLAASLWPPEIMRVLLDGQGYELPDETVAVKLREIVQYLDGTPGSFAA